MTAFFGDISTNIVIGPLQSVRRNAADLQFEAFNTLTDASISSILNNQNRYLIVDTISTDTSLSSLNHFRILVSNLTSIGLPTAYGISGTDYNVVRVGTSNVTINPTTPETISGDSNLVLTNQWDSVVIVSDGSNWVRCS
jgi:hypothetical protein